jgi:hypothetical protein
MFVVIVEGLAAWHMATLEALIFRLLYLNLLVLHIRRKKGAGNIF